ncbi:hypothetical protein AMTRI_Chr07g76160 [Amborella trichopoda]
MQANLRMAILERIARSFICCKKRGIDNGRGVTVISLQRQRPMTVWGNRVVRWRHLLWRVKASWRQGMGMRKNKVKFSYDPSSYSRNFDDGLLSW